MRFLILVPGNEQSEVGDLPSEEIFVEMTKYNQQLVDAGVMLAAHGLYPTSKAAKVKFSGGKRTVIDGPFSETKEVIAGFWLIEAKSMEEAIEWVKRAPFDGGVEIQIRPVQDTEDLGDAVPEEVRIAEQRMSEQMAAQQRQRE